MSPHLDPHRLVAVGGRAKFVTTADDDSAVSVTYWRCRCGAEGLLGPDDDVRSAHGRHAAEATLDALDAADA